MEIECQRIVLASKSHCSCFGGFIIASFVCGGEDGIERESGLREMREACCLRCIWFVVCVFALRMHMLCPSSMSFPLPYLFPATYCFRAAQLRV